MYKLKDFIYRKRSTIEAFTLVEILVAAIIILIVLISSAYGITSAVKATAYTENYTKANQLANQQIAIAKQVPYNQLWIPRSASAGLIGNFKCDPATGAAPTGTAYAISGAGTQYEGLTYCQTKKFGGGTGVGTTFYIQTTVSYIRTGVAYDGASIGNAPAGYYAKRVFVIVRWSDVSTDVTGSDANSNNVVYQTYTRTPTTGECIPDTITSGGVVITGCAP